MKSRSIQAFLSLALIFGIGAAATVKAASSSQLNVPFDFTVNGKSMKAGSYEIRFGISASDKGAFLLRSADGRDAVIVADASTNKTLALTANTEMIFEKSENGYVLSEVHSARASVKLSKSNRAYAKIVRVEVGSAN